MANYVNNSGQIRLGWRTPVVVVSNQPTISASLLQSLYGVWNGDKMGTDLGTSIFGVWNGEVEENLASLENSLFSVYNGESNVNDSFGMNNGTAVGSLSYVVGKVGNAFSFNGSNSYVSLPNSSGQFNFTGDFSVSFWVNLTSGVYTWKSLVSNYKAGGSFGYGYGIGINEYYDKVQIFIRNNNQITQQWFDYAFSANTWYHVVICRKSSNYTKCYINGSLVSGYYPIGGQNSPIFNPAYISNQVINIGEGFNGKMDSVNFWTKELTQTEVTQLYNSGVGIEYPFVGKLLSSPKDSVGTNHGTLMNGCTFESGKIGQAFSLDGINDYIELGDVMDVGRSSWSYAFWFKTFDAVNSGICFSKSFAGNNSGRFWAGPYNNRFAWNFQAGTNVIYIETSNGTILPNTWYHVVCVLDRNDKLKLYINGSLASVNVTSGTNNLTPYLLDSFNTTHPFRIGAYTDSNNTTPIGTFKGQIDAFSVWNKVLSQDEIIQLYNLGNGVQYPFSAQTLPSVNNQFGMDNGTLMNGASLSTGKIGQAFTFDGVNDYVSLPDNSLNFTGDFSVSAWIYVSNLSGEKYIISNVNGNALDVNIGWCFGVFDNKVSFWVYPQGSSYTGWLTNTTILLNTWYHVSVTKKPSQSPLIYINGTLSSTSLYNNSMSSSINPIYSTTTYPNTKTSIGVYRYNNGSSAYAYWNGKIDALNVYQKELTQSEITELYNSGAGKQITATPIVQTGLVLNLDASRKSSYPNTGTTWTDISGSGNNGTLTNGASFATASDGVISFDGVNDFVKVPLNLSSYSQITVEIWYKMNQGSSNLATWGGMMWEHSSDWNSNQGGIGLAVNSGGCSPNLNLMHTNHNGGSGAINYEYYSGTTWSCHVNIFSRVSDPTGRLAYVNGQLVPFTLTNTCSGVAFSSSTATSDSYSPFRNDFLYLSSRNGTGAFINGNIGLIRVYSRKLSASEILQNFNASKSRFGL